MKYLVVSDNHGDRNILVEIVNRYVGMVDQMFHCGDSELKANDELWQHFTVVTGIAIMILHIRKNKSFLSAMTLSI